MDKNIRNIAIAALFVFPGLSGFPQEVQQTAAPVTPISALAAQVQVVRFKRCIVSFFGTVRRQFGENLM